MTIRQQLSDIVCGAFEACGYAREFGVVTVSNRPDLCQFQCNGAMAAAKQYKKAPIAIAGEVVARLGDHPTFALAEAVVPGFINLNLADGVLAGTMNGMLADPRLLLPTMPPRTIVVDFGGPNIAKPLHVGHLRSAIIGDCLCRLARFLGHTVIGDVHLGDWGLQMGMVIAEIRRLQPELVYFDPDYTGDYPAQPPITADALNALYPAASARAKADADFAAEAGRATVELQRGRRGYLALWRKIRDVSVADLKRNYDTLGVQFDAWLGESDADADIPRVMQLLKERGLLRESDGALVVDVEQEDDREPMPPMLVVKSDGGDIYGTTDLGTLYQRMRDWKPDEIWYVVDNRQALHFKQVFRCAALAGFLGETVCRHIGFGTMNGKDGKPYKTRDGGVMRLSDLIDSVTENALQKTRESAASADDGGAEDIAKTVGIAAMKIGDFINHRTKDYIFDMDRFLASDGKTGPYLQYTAVRIQSVLRKARAAGEPLGEIIAPLTAAERDLMLALTAVAEMLPRAFEDKAPNAICETLFDIAGIFNRFYLENRILSYPDPARRASWLSLLGLTHAMLTQLLAILGISVPERM